MPSINLYSSRVHPRRLFPVSSWVNGISDFNKVGGSYLWGRGVDYRTEPSQLTLLPAPIQEVGPSLMIGLGKWAEQVVGRTVILGNSTNLVSNGSFEINTTGWTLGADYTRASDDAQIGGFSIKQVSAGGTVTFTTASGSGIAVSQYTDYQITFWTKVAMTSGIAPSFNITGGVLAGPNLLQGDQSLPDTGGVWKEISVTFNSGIYTSIFLNIKNNSGTLTAHYDNFSLFQINSLATFVYDDAGNFYKRYSDGAYVGLGSVPNSHGNGMAYYGEDDFVYLMGDTTIGRYGPISSGTPTLVTDFLTAQSGVPTNTNSVVFIAANGDYANKATPSSAVKITGDLGLEIFIKPTSLPAVGNSMTLVGLWKESLNERAWKFDIYGISGVFGTGSDGSLTVSVNTTDAPIDSAASGNSGTNQLFANNVSFATGQNILIIQMQGTGAGTYQETTIQSYDSTNHIITTTSNLNFSYNSTGINRAQVLVGKQYTNVTVNTGITWTEKAWNGTTGGILYFFANGTVTVTGTISGLGCGFRGGAGVNNQVGAGFTGEGPGGPTVNSPDSSPNGTPSPFNNPGAGVGGGLVHIGSTGGGGASYATSGTYSAYNNQGNLSNGAPGTVYGTTNLSTLFLGSGGGGANQWEQNGSSKYGGNGGNGGGIVFGYWANLVVTGSITVNGQDGFNSVTGGTYGGGAGSGGSFLAKVQSAIVGTNLITSLGGTGGQGEVGFSYSGSPGGNGGVGYNVIDYLSSFTGATNPTVNAIQDNTLVTSISYQARLGISNDGTSFEYLTQNLKSIAVGAWDRLQVSWAAASSTASFLEGGVPLGTAVGTKTVIFGATADLAVGGNIVTGTTYTNLLDAEVNDVRIWNTQRTQGQFAANNFVNLAGVAPGLVGAFFLSATNTDQTANANDLTLQGTPTPLYTTDVPYSGATTRLDLDQTGGGTASTYALPTVLTENQKQTFIPALDPQKSLQVQISAKGTGNVTLVVHDGLNRQVALVTVASANLPTSGLYEFIYSQVFVPVVGATYHFHLYSSVNDCTVKATSLNTASTILFNTYYQYLVSDTEYHTAMQMGNILGICNGRYLAVQDAAAGYNSRRLRFPAGWRARCLATWNGFYAIGCWRGTNIKDFDQGIVFLWDGYSVTYNDFFFVPEGAINAMWGENDTLYIIAGYKGDVLEYTGASKTNLKVKRLPKVGKTSYIEVAPGGMTFWQGLLRIGAAYNSDSGTFERGIYSWGNFNVGYEKSLSYDYPISTGNRFSTVSMGALVPVGGSLLSFWKDSVSHGADNINISNPPQATGTLEELIVDFDIYWKNKEALTIRADHFPLKAGENIDVKYKANYESGWHNLGITSQKVGDTITRLPLLAPNTQYHALQIATDLYATQGTTPVILEHSQESDLLLTETDESGALNGQ